MSKDQHFEATETKLAQSKDASEYTKEVRPRLRWLWILIALTILGSVVFILSLMEDTIDVTESSGPPPLQLVSIQNVSVGSQQIEIQSFSEVKPRWSAELTSTIAGKIINVFDSALAGEPVKAGTRLIEIENSQYIAGFASAEQALMQAKLALLQAQNATLLARKDYERNGQTPPNDLALKLPQLQIAERAVEAAEARVKSAKKQLTDTIVIAPFDAYVAQRFVSPGQSINPGGRLVKLVDQSTFELVVELSREDWSRLRKPLESQFAQVLDQSGNEIALAQIRRGGGFLDEKTRQYKIFLEVKNPESNSILSGDFVTVLFQGIEEKRALELPASALSQDGYVWHLDDDDRLVRVEPEVLFRRHDHVVVKAPNGITRWRVVLTPLVSFLPGQKVKPNLAEN